MVLHGDVCGHQVGGPGGGLLAAEHAGRASMRGVEHAREWLPDIVVPDACTGTEADAPATTRRVAASPTVKRLVNVTAYSSAAVGGSGVVKVTIRRFGFSLASDR
jgi:hypothetical protein